MIEIQKCDFQNLEKYISFYDDLANSELCINPEGVKSTIYFNLHFFRSMKCTLKSIQDTIINARINDAYALLRKYYDAIIINIYTNLFLEENFSLENLIVEQIELWVKGEKKLPSYGEMRKYIENSEKFMELNVLLLEDEKYLKIRKRCNDNLHYNSFFCSIINDNKMNIRHRSLLLKKFLMDVDDLFVFHISYVFFQNGIYMMSSDYVDCLDIGIPPDPETLFDVAPYVQKMFDEIIKSKRMDVFELIKNNTDMKLE